MRCKAQADACKEDPVCRQETDENLQQLEDLPTMKNAGVLIEGAEQAGPKAQDLAKCIRPRSRMMVACLYEKRTMNCLAKVGCQAEVEACMGSRNCARNTRTRANYMARDPSREMAEKLAKQPRKTPEGVAMHECD